MGEQGGGGQKRSEGRKKEADGTDLRGRGGEGKGGGEEGGRLSGAAGEIHSWIARRAGRGKKPKETGKRTPTKWAGRCRGTR